MNKTLVIGGALLLATLAGSAFAQPYYGSYGAYGYNGYDYQNPVRQYLRQLRACRQHERMHEALDSEHAEEHAEGITRGEHHELHEDLGDAHDVYHATHPRADFCDSFPTHERMNPYAYGPYAYGQYGYYGR